MSEVIKNYLARYFDVTFTQSLLRKRSLEQAKKYQAFYEYLDLDMNKLFRQRDEPSGLRNIGNTCYFNVFLQLLYHINSIRDMFIQGSMRDVKGGTLPSCLQNLFARMLNSKFSYCDPSDVFATLNRSNPDKIQLGDEYDLNQYFSMTMDTIEKCLKKEPGLEGKEKVLEKIFFGKMNQSLDDGKNNIKSEAKFGMITLDIKDGSLHKGFQSFRNYNVDGYKSEGGVKAAKMTSDIVVMPELLTFYVNRVELKDGRLTKNNGKFEFPQVLRFHRQKDKLEFRLDVDCNEIQRKITRLQEILDKKQYLRDLQALRRTESFLEKQQFEDLSLTVSNFGVFGSQNQHDLTKKRLRQYIEKLEKHQDDLNKTLQKLVEQRRVGFEDAKIIEYPLMAVMIHQGSAVSGHYFIYIYNESQRKWRKYNDRFVSQVTFEEMQKVALGQGNGNTNVSCLIYKSSDFKCDPFVKPTMSATLKHSVSKDDEHVVEMINRVRLERMLRNYEDIAKEEVELYKDMFDQDPLTAINYFSDPCYYFIGRKELRLAEFTKVKEMISEPMFLVEANNSMLQPCQPITLPNLGIEPSKQYLTLQTTIKQAIDQQSKGNILLCLQYLLTNRHYSNNETVVRNMYDCILAIFLFKACFYMDLYIQTNKDHKELYEFIKFARSTLKGSNLTMQIDENLRNSLGNQYSEKTQKIVLSANIFKDARQASQININMALRNRFKTWVDFFQSILQRNTIVRQDDRSKQEVPLYILYIRQ